MSKASHTPTTGGPWCFEPHGAFGTDFLGEDWPLGYISREVPRTPIFALGPILELPTDELLACARLIAAAPELLAALRVIVHAPHGVTLPSGAYIAAQHAIAKAEGRHDV